MWDREMGAGGEVSGAWYQSAKEFVLLYFSSLLRQLEQFFQILLQHWSLGIIELLVIELADHLIEQLF